MLGMAKTVSQDSSFAVGQAERLPFRGQSFGWMSAAGSLNYVALDSFFGEARRVLDPEGRLLVYDFSPGRTFPHTGVLDAWFTSFVERYPWKASEAHVLDPARLDGLGMGFQVEASEQFEVGVELNREFYVNYMMTESNVAYALRRGIEEASIRGWVEETLPESGWGAVMFRGYWAIMRMWN
jgi:SAM-dependent methyltransferase